MKKLLFLILVGAIALLGVCPSAQADSFLSISVTAGGTSAASCNNSTAGGVSSCLGLGFLTSLGSDNILYTGPALQGVSFVFVGLSGNQPGSPAGANTSDSKFRVTNGNATAAAIKVDFASNNFSIPGGSPLMLTGTQSVDDINSLTPIAETFNAWGDAGNGLIAGVGTGLGITTCTTGGPGTSCAKDSNLTSFTRIGNFGLNGEENFILTSGSTVSAQASVVATSPVPEPSSVLLLGTGMLCLAAGRKWRQSRS